MTLFLHADSFCRTGGRNMNQILQTQTIETLQDTVETLHLQIEDSKDIVKRLENDCFDYKHTISYLTSQLSSVKASHTQQLAERESRLIKALKELETTEANRKYACDHIQQQNQFIRDAKSTVQKLWEEIQTLQTANNRLVEEKVNAEHLGKKVIELRNDNVRLMNENGSMACPYQRTKNIIHLRCGKCTACKLEAAEGIIERTSQNIGTVQEELAELKEQVEFKTTVLKQTSDNLIAANKERDKAAQDLRTAHTVSEEAIKHLREVINLQATALSTIAKGAFFNHKRLATDALQAANEREFGKLL